MNYLEASTWDKITYMAKLDHAARKSQIVRDSLEEVLGYAEEQGLFNNVQFNPPVLPQVSEDKLETYI